jgi:hypothetical protein
MGFSHASENFEFGVNTSVFSRVTEFRHADLVTFD